MIKCISCVDFQDSAHCRSDLFESKESFLRTNYDFYGGNAYGVVSDFGCGGWGLVTCLGGRNCSDEWFCGQILADQKAILPKQLRKHSAFVGEKIFDEIVTVEEMSSAKQCIEEALKLSGQPYSVDDVKRLFGLSDERFERNLDNVGIEINRISVAINFALGKDIFCYPWLNEHDVENISCHIINVLKAHEKIVLIPTSQEKAVKKLCNHLICYSKGKIKYR